MGNSAPTAAGSWTKFPSFFSKNFTIPPKGSILTYYGAARRGKFHTKVSPAFEKAAGSRGGAPGGTPTKGYSMKRQTEQTKFRTSIGGQALIEGILMRGPHKQAVVVRDPQGELVIKEEELRLIREKYPVLGLPLIRGSEIGRASCRERV